MGNQLTHPMKKAKTIPQPPALPATDHPTGVLRPGAICGLFSLVDPPQPRFLHNQLFHSYNLEELKKELGRFEALEKKNKGSCYTVYTEPLREQIRLIELLNTPKDGMSFLRWDFERADVFQAELMYLLASQKDEKAFRSYSEKTHNYFWHLKRMASDGHAEALRSLATLAIEATEVVNKFAVEQPEIFIPVAREQVYWPFLKSLDKKLDQIKSKAEAPMLKGMKLGEDLQRKPLASATRFGPKNPKTEVATRLLDYVRGLRRFAMAIANQNRLNRSEPARETEDEPTRETKDLFMQAGRLPEVVTGPGAAERWWKLAKAFLLESYPALDPEGDAPLEAVAPTLLALSKAGNSQDRKRRILYNIERKFAGVLAKSPPSPPAPPPPPPVVNPRELLEKFKRTNPDTYNWLFTNISRAK
jgi:hypothetical protein